MVTGRWRFVFSAANRAMIADTVRRHPPRSILCTHTHRKRSPALLSSSDNFMQCLRRRRSAYGRSEAPPPQSTATEAMKRFHVDQVHEDLGIGEGTKVCEKI